MVRVKRLCKGDVMQVSVNTLANPKKVKIGNYLNLQKTNAKLSVVNSRDENSIGYIVEHIVVRYKFKEIWDIFIKYLFRVPKINDIRFKIIKETEEE
jgi:hypothetical protein